MGGTADPWYALRLLEEGRRRAAAAFLRRAFPDGRRPGSAGSAEARLAWALHRALDSAGTPSDPDVAHARPAGDDGGVTTRTRPSGDGEVTDPPHVGPVPTPPPDDVQGAIRALDLVGEASAALRSGRIDDLVRATTAAERAAPESMPWIRFRVASLLHACFRFTGDPDAMASALAVCGPLADAVGRPHLAVSARGLMAGMHLLAGTYHRTVDLCTAGLELARETDVVHGAPVALAYQFRGYVLFEWDRVDDARDDLRRAWELAGDGNRGVRSGVARVLARLAADRGDRDAARRWLGEIEALVREPMTLRNREWRTAVRIRHALGTGDLRAVESWLRSYGYAADRLEARTTGELAARLQELDHVLEALETLERWDEIRAVAPLVWRASRGRRRWFAARAASALAVALEAGGHPGEADAWWDRALEEGAPGSFVRAYLEGDSLRLRLARRASETDGASAEAARVHAAARAREGGRSTAGPLTPRQLDVLARVARGGSNKRVARELGLSLSTVKTHLRHAFRRLDATSRTEAVTRAREAGILE